MFIDTVLHLIMSKIIPFALALSGFAFLIIFHECGHFLMCKLFGIRVPTFSLGFGPKIIEKKIGETNFQIAPFPLGGYVEVAGLHEPGQGEQVYAFAQDDRSFARKPYWQKVLVLLGGIIFNLSFAYVTFSAFYFIGIPQEKAHVQIQEIEKDSAAQRAGLLRNDILISINGKLLSNTPKELMSELENVLLPEIANHPDQEISLIINRNNTSLTLPILLGTRERGGKTVGALGAMFGVTIDTEKDTYVRYDFLTAIKKGIERTNQYIMQIGRFLKSMVYERTLKGTGGPIMILSLSFSMAQKSLSLFLIFLAIISINLAVLNLLPFGPLDGSQLLFVTIESALGRELPLALKERIMIGFWVLFLLLFLVLTYRDILALLS